MRKRQMDDKFPCYLLASMGEALSTLSEREKKVLVTIWIDDKTLEQAGHEFKVTRERVRQIEAKALRKLAHPTRAKILMGFIKNDSYPEMVEWYLKGLQKRTTP